MSFHAAIVKRNEMIIMRCSFACYGFACDATRMRASRCYSSSAEITALVRTFLIICLRKREIEEKLARREEEGGGMEIKSIVPRKVTAENSQRARNCKGLNNSQAWQSQFQNGHACAYVTHSKIPCIPAGSLWNTGYRSSFRRKNWQTRHLHGRGIL